MNDERSAVGRLFDLGGGQSGKSALPATKRGRCDERASDASTSTRTRRAHLEAVRTPLAGEVQLERPGASEEAARLPVCTD